LKKLTKQRDNLPDEKNNDRTSWKSLKKINYALKEEQEISQMIGV